MSFDPLHLNPCTPHSTPPHHAQVAGRALFPGAGMFEACTAAVATLLGGFTAALLHSLVISAPLVMPLEAGLQLGVVVHSRSGSVELHSLRAGAKAAAQELHCRAHAGAAVTWPTLPAVSGQHAPTGASGPASTQLWLAAPAAPAAGQRAGPCAELAAGSSVQGGFAAHPAAVDCTLQLGAASSLPSGSAPPVVPVGLGALLVPAVQLSTAATWLTARMPDGVAGSVHGLNASLTCQLSQLSWQLQGYVVKYGGAAAQDAMAGSYMVAWRRARAAVANR